MNLASRLFVFLSLTALALTSCHELGHVDGLGNYGGAGSDVVGEVEYVDQRRGTFELRDQRNRLIIVSVAFNAPGPVIDQFNRLRNGDYVRIEGKSVSSDRFELENFM